MPHHTMCEQGTVFPVPLWEEAPSPVLAWALSENPVPLGDNPAVLSVGPAPKHQRLLFYLRAT